MIKITRINEKALEKLCYANLDQFSIAREEGVREERAKEMPSHYIILILQCATL